MLCPEILVCGYWLAYGDIRILEVYGTYVRPLEDICTEHREQKLSFALDYLWIGCLSKEGETGEGAGKIQSTSSFAGWMWFIWKRYCIFWKFAIFMADWGANYFSLRLTAFLKPNDNKLKKKEQVWKFLPLAPELMQLKNYTKNYMEID